MLLVKPEGTLSVTYTLKSAGQAAPAELTRTDTGPSSGLAARLFELDQAKAAGQITEEEYATTRTRILGDVWPSGRGRSGRGIFDVASAPRPVRRSLHGGPSRAGATGV